jgi:hypothetical protein
LVVKCSNKNETNTRSVLIVSDKTLSSNYTQLGSFFPIMLALLSIVNLMVNLIRNCVGREISNTATNNETVRQNAIRKR